MRHMGHPFCCNFVMLSAKLSLLNCACMQHACFMHAACMKMFLHACTLNCMHADTYCMHADTYCMHAEGYCMYAGGYCMHADTHCLHTVRSTKITLRQKFIFLIENE